MFTKADANKIKSRITSILNTSAGISPAKTIGILPVKDLQGKIFEAFVLSRIIENLVTRETCTILLKQGSNLRLKQKGSPINLAYPFFQVYRGGKLIGELFTDTEFTGISYEWRGSGKLQSGDYHELDIVMFQPGESGRPSFKQVMLAVECKATAVDKSTFREILGFRRELSYLTDMPTKTNFHSWPATMLRVSPEPASAHLLYTTDAVAQKYELNAAEFGIQIIVEKM